MILSGMCFAHNIDLINPVFLSLLSLPPLPTMQPPTIEDDELGDASAAAKSAYKLVGTAMKQGNAAAAMVHLRSLEAALRI